MKLETIKLSELNPAEYNPRTITKEEFEGLKKSLETFGQQENLIVNKDMTVISGHQRLEAMKALGWTEAVCNMVDLDKHAEKKLNVIMNSTAISGKYDDLKLSEILEELKLDDDYESLRLNVLEPLDLSDIEVEEDEAPEVDEGGAAKSVLGTVYQLGRHKVMCGDCTIANNVHTLVPNNTTITFTSPPYNVGHNLGYKNKDSKYENDTDDKTEQEYGELLTGMTTIAQEVTKYQFINLQFLANNKRAILRWIASERDRFVDIAFWRKLQVAPAMAENVMNSATEVIFILSSKDNASRAVDTANFRGTVSNFVETKSASSENENADIHNATYPVGFVTYFTDNFTKKGDSIYDPFLGSGTTLIACEQTDRTCYGMELDEKYLDVIRKRWAKYVYPDRWEKEWEILTPAIEKL